MWWNWIPKLAGTCRRTNPEGKHSKTSGINNQPQTHARVCWEQARDEQKVWAAMVCSVQYSTGAARDGNQRSAGNDHLSWEPITLYRAEPQCQGHVQSSCPGPALWATLSSLPGVRHQIWVLGQEWSHCLPQSSHFNLLRSENIRVEWEMSKAKLWIRFWKGNETDGRRFQLDKYRRGKEEKPGYYIVRMGLRLDQSTYGPKLIKTTLPTFSVEMIISDNGATRISSRNILKGMKIITCKTEGKAYRIPCAQIKVPWQISISGFGKNWHIKGAQHNLVFLFDDWFFFS